MIWRLKILILSILLAACSSNFSYHQRDLPEGYNKVAVPVFVNSTEQVGIEAFFTNALINRFHRSQVAKIIPKENAEVFIEGDIKEVRFEHGGQVDSSDKDNNNQNVLLLPDNTVLTVEYRINVLTEVRLTRKADKKVLWQGRFQNERVFKAPQIGLAVLNTANPLYGHSAHMEIIQKMAAD